MNCNVIRPDKVPAINLMSDICIIKDHMPPLSCNFPENSVADYYEFNTINDILYNKMAHVNTLIFDHYHYLTGFEKYNTFYFEQFFNFQVSSYNSLNKENATDFSIKTKKFNYLANKPRESRMLASLWLANNYKNYNEFNYTQNYNYSDFKDLIDEFIHYEKLQLESKFFLKKWVQSDSRSQDPTEKNVGRECDNFYNALKNEIAPTVFSIVIEPVFWENGCILTEKYINAILGGTIPIVNGYRVYEVIKEMGFDSFEDVIDTSAQFETNSTLRILNLLENNKQQIDNAMIIIKDKTIQKRIVNNIKILENYDFNLAKSRYSPDVVEFLKQSVYK